MYHKSILTVLTATKKKKIRITSPIPLQRESTVSRYHYINIDFIKIKNFLLFKYQLREQQAREWWKICPNHLSDKRLVSEMSYSTQAAITNYHVLCGLKNIYFTQF